MIDARSLSLDELFHSFIKLSLQANSYEYNMVLFSPREEVSKYAWPRFIELLESIHTWLRPPESRRQGRSIQFANGCSIKILNSALSARGMRFTHCGLYLHPDQPWTREDMNSILPSIKAPLDQHFCYVIE